MHIELNRFSSTGSKGLCPPHMKFSQTGKIVFNTDMRPICFSNEHTKMHWYTKVGGTHTEFTICYKSQKYFWALSSSKILFDKEDLVRKKKSTF